MEAGNLTSTMNLNTLKYASLQELAKKCGLKANLKAEKLRDSIRIHLSSPNSNTDKINVDEEKMAKNRNPVGNNKVKRIRKRTFELDEAAMGSLTPEILKENKVNDPKKTNQTMSSLVHNLKNSVNKQRAYRNGDMTDAPPIKWKLIEEENKPPPVPNSDRNAGASTSSNPRKRIALRPQRILRNAQGDPSKIPRPARVITDATITKKSTPNFARIHKRIFDNMDSVDVYEEKKRFRAKRLQSGLSPTLASIEQKPEPVAKRAIFAPSVFAVKDANFNFTRNAPVQFQARKIATAAKSLPNLRIRSPRKVRTREVKRPNGDHRQMYKTRKVKGSASAGKLHQYVAGVRTNRRFDLQMQMRAKII